MLLYPEISFPLLTKVIFVELRTVIKLLLFEALYKPGKFTVASLQFHSTIVCYLIKWDCHQFIDLIYYNHLTYLVVNGADAVFYNYWTILGIQNGNRRCHPIKEAKGPENIRRCHLPSSLTDLLQSIGWGLSTSSETLWSWPETRATRNVWPFFACNLSEDMCGFRRLCQHATTAENGWNINANKQTNVQSRLFWCHLESPTTTISTCIFILFFSLQWQKKIKMWRVAFFFHPWSNCSIFFVLCVCAVCPPPLPVLCEITLTENIGIDIEKTEQRIGNETIKRKKDCYVYVINVWNNKLNMNLNESVVVSNEKSSRLRLTRKI